MVAEGTVPPNQPATDPGRNMPGVDGNHASLNDVGKNIGAAYAHALTYVSAQADRLKIAIRNAILFSVIGIVGIVFLLGLLITATVLLLHGVAGGISSGLGIRPWAGDVITGGGVVAGIAIVAMLIVTRINKAARSATISSYEKRRIQK